MKKKFDEKKWKAIDKSVQVGFDVGYEEMAVYLTDDGWFYIEPWAPVEPPPAKKSKQSNL